MAMEAKRALVEFLTVAAIFLVLAFSLVVFTLANVDEKHVVYVSFLDLLKMVVGALIALAYAARGIVRRNGNGNGS